jgi:hypothetical protein
MPKATYSKKLFKDIRSGTWREPELDLSDQRPKLMKKLGRIEALCICVIPFRP